MDFTSINNIGRQVKNARQALDWTQEDLASSAQVCARTVRRLEKGQNVHIDSLVRIINALSPVKNDDTVSKIQAIMSLLGDIIDTLN